MAIVQRGLKQVVASYTATGASYSLDLGAIPAYALGLCITTPTQRWEWTSGMSSANALSSTTVFGIIATTGGIVPGSIGAGAGGITVMDGSAGTGIGLTIGTNTTINTASEVWNVYAVIPN